MMLSPPFNPQRILVIKLRYIGDVLLCTPILRALKQQFPSAHMTCLVNPGTEEVLQHNPYLDDVLLVVRSGWLSQLQWLRGIRTRKFDCVIDLTDGDRAALITALTGAARTIGFNNEARWRGRLYSHCVSAKYGSMPMVDYFSQALSFMGYEMSLGDPEVFVGEEEERSAWNLLETMNLAGKPWVMIHPTARYPFKAWPPERFACLSDCLAENDLPVVLVGNQADQKTAHLIQNKAQLCPCSLVGQTTFLELAALMKHCALFVGNDSGPMHLAAAVGCPVLALFGPSNPYVWGPKGNRVSVIYKGMECEQCYHAGCFRGEKSCMRMISVEEVYAKALDMLSGKNEEKG